LCILGANHAFIVYYAQKQAENSAREILKMRCGGKVMIKVSDRKL